MEPSKERQIDLVILHNRVKCLKCNTVIESKHRHDFVSCICGAIFTDGGKDYIRRGGNPSDMEDMTEYKES